MAKNKLTREECLALLDANPMTISVMDAAKVLGCTEMCIRCGLRATPPRFPFGTAVQMQGGKWTYVIITPMLRQFAAL